MKNNLEFENEDPSPDSIEDNHPRTNYGEGYYVKETLEEAAEKYKINIKEAIQFGAKWQAEKMYSEEEVLAIIFQKRMPYMTDTEIIEWFEQFKKK